MDSDDEDQWHVIEFFSGDQVDNEHLMTLLYFKKLNYC